MSLPTRLDDLTRFYALLDELAARLGGVRRLSECSGRMAWPRRGVYFFLKVARIEEIVALEREGGHLTWGRGSLRRLLGRNSIALLSNVDKVSPDPASDGWNQNHVHERHDRSFLGVLEVQILALPETR